MQSLHHKHDAVFSTCGDLFVKTGRHAVKKL